MTPETRLDHGSSGRTWTVSRSAVISGSSAQLSHVRFEAVLPTRPFAEIEGDPGTDGAGGTARRARQEDLNHPAVCVVVQQTFNSAASRGDSR
jgi:hypothetical protein